jgi:hypothetical protein
MKTGQYLPESELERRVQSAQCAPCPRRSYDSGEGVYFFRRLRRFGAAAAGASAAAAAFLRRLTRRFGAAGAAFFAFFRAAMVHPLVDENVRRGRSLERTFSPFVHDVKSMLLDDARDRSAHTTTLRSSHVLGCTS